ncbi:DUF4131 domain-containing protein [Sulfuriflexus sp.]|uniref:DUF4131 domain-containing protein n=1 Tax=Sulfuriflexus sp. TaxID=2015443 RepID=UPI0028CCE100|nr:DUF4131 domain-containing protein [Sulfuriflexus sp.]MDT8403689.1 hypothetical protein [Sulfuriflexus sp.]
MRLGTIAFLLGILAAQQLTSLPPTGWLALLPFCLGLAYFAPPYWHLPFIAGAGFLWAILFAGQLLDHRLAPGLEGSDLLLEGSVSSLPQIRERSQRFDFGLFGKISG